MAASERKRKTKKVDPLEGAPASIGSIYVRNGREVPVPKAVEKQGRVAIEKFVTSIAGEQETPAAETEKRE